MSKKQKQLQFWECELYEKERLEDLLEWAANDELVGLVDEAEGGIIGYIHKTHITRITKELNRE